MLLHENVSLRNFNTFNIEAKARYFTEIHTSSDVKKLTSVINQYPRFLLLGDGSNILFTKDYDGLVVRICMKGIEIAEQSDNHFFLKVAAGENWSDLVDYCVSKGYSGIETLALIPGKAGSAPVQNIGAYGTEIKDVLHCLEAVELESGNPKIFQNKACRFAYRNSIFKQELKDKYLITFITLKLGRNFEPNIDYKVLKESLLKKGITNPTIKDAANCVKEIRLSKLPDHNNNGNAGSFFKNPIIEKEQFDILQQNYTDIPYYEKNGKYKIPAAWLIDQCGWKRKRTGNVGVHEKQSLVLVNYGKAKGEEILNLSKKIQESIYSKFKIHLQAEVNIL